MVRNFNNNNNNNPSSYNRFLTTTTTTLNNQHEEENNNEEFDESDVVWSSTSSTTTTTTSAAVTTTANHHHPFSLSSLRPSAGISAALFTPDPPQSPTSIQRKTTLSSPISMISSPPEGGGPGHGPGPMVVGPYYGNTRKYHQSAPVNVPVWPKGRFNMARFDDVDDNEGFQDDDDMVPPHEIVARSQKTTTFSVIEGAGRTLKGRDLTAVRNAVFQKTGFL